LKHTLPYRTKEKGERSALLLELWGGERKEKKGQVLGGTGIAQKKRVEKYVEEGGGRAFGRFRRKRRGKKGKRGTRGVTGKGVVYAFTAVSRTEGGGGLGLGHQHLGPFTEHQGKGGAVAFGTQHREEGKNCPISCASSQRKKIKGTSKNSFSVIRL